MTDGLAILGDDAARVAELAARTGAQIGTRPGALTLVVLDDRLELRLPGDRAGVAVDLLSAENARRARGGRRSSFARALGLDRGVRTVLDATAGLGRDAAAIAALGARVTLCERHPVLVALLEDGIARARAADAALAERLTLVRGDAREHLRTLGDAARPDAVYVDPMFPARGKTALPGKDLQVLRALLGHDAGAELDELVAVARAVARRRVVVKRPPHAPPIGGRPDASQVGSRVRYDVFTPRPRT